MPNLPDDVTTNDGLYGYTASTMEVKMQSGETKEEPTLPHIGRLISPRLAQGFASQHHEAVLEGARRVLLAEKLSPIQQARLTLPEYEGGGALTTAKQVLNGAFLGSAGATARWLSGKWWPECAEYLKVMASHSEYQNVANLVEQQFEAYGATAQAGTTRPP